jgi:4-hydroxybenzoate polyprenyltransferase
VLLSGVSGPATATAAAGCLGLGYVYDLRLSRTAWSWLPLALALPLLPSHAWLGATGELPAGLVTLIPVALLAGAGLSIANGLVDVERDARGGRRSVVVALGRRPAWSLQTALLLIAVALAIGIAPAVPDGLAAGRLGGGLDPGALRSLRTAGVLIGAVVIGLGAVLLVAARPAIRERGWELEALGVAALGVGWLAGTAGAVAGAVPV